MKIIDARARPNTAEYMRIFESPTTAHSMELFGFPIQPTITLPEFVAEMDALGVQKVIYPGRQIEGFGVTNDHVASTAAAYPDRIVGFGSLDLRQGTASCLEEIARCRELGLRGISIDQGPSNFAADDRRLYPIYAECARRSLPMVLTFGPLVNRYLDLGSPLPIDHVAADFPNLRVLCAHGSWPWVTEMIAVALRHDNVYFDASAWFRMPGHEPLVAAVNSGIVRSKFLFASGLPFNPMRAAIDDFLAMGWSAEALPAVMHDNALAFMGSPT